MRPLIKYTTISKYISEYILDKELEQELRELRHRFILSTAYKMACDEFFTPKPFDLTKEDKIEALGFKWYVDDEIKDKAYVYDDESIANLYVDDKFKGIVFGKDKIKELKKLED